jgi:UDP-glucuronate 4-epimerase
MALFLFTKNIIEGKSIDVFNHGNHTRDFTFVEDIVNGLIKIHEKPPVNQESFNVMEPDKSSAPFRIVNIGNNNPTKLLDYISAIEIKLNKKADVNKLIDEFEYEPSVSVVEGVGKFIDWYIDYYDIKS